MLSRWLIKVPTLFRGISLYYSKVPAAQFPEGKRMTYTEYERSFNATLHAFASKVKTKEKIRTGVIGYKQGMTSIWNEWGVNIPCTVVQVYPFRHS